jgi:two-component system, response regulator RegA
MAHILVLDDVLDAAVLAQKILGKKGHQVTVFTDEDKAMRHAAQHRVDLAILDINLKKTDGISLLAEFRRRKPAMRVIMLTGHPSGEAARQAQLLGAAAYCVKPVDKNELEEKVAAALAGTPTSEES